MKKESIDILFLLTVTALASAFYHRVGHNWAAIVHFIFKGFPGDAGSISASGRFLGVRNGNPFQYSFLENSMNRGA